MANFTDQHQQEMIMSSVGGSLAHSSIPQAAMFASPQLVTSSYSFELTPGPSSYQQSNIGGQPHQQQDQRAVLHIVVENSNKQLTLDEYYEIFSQYGTVLKIITYQKVQFQALIEMSHADEAAAAKLVQDGKYVNNETKASLRVDYSSRDRISVKPGDVNSRDYLLEPFGTQRQIYYAPQLLTAPSSSTLLHSAHQASPYNYQSNIQLFGPSSIFQHPQQYLATSYNIPPSLVPTAVPVVGLKNSVLFVAGLNEQKTKPEHLFILFGVYGDVHRVKIIFRNKSTALVQMSTHAQAQLVTQHCNHLRLFGGELQIREAQKTQIYMPREGQDEQNLTRDFTNSPLHRFKRAGSKNYKHIYAPSSILHLSNIPDETTEMFIRDAFQSHCQCQVKSFKFFERSHQMALMELNTVEEAVAALVAMHNFKLNDNHCLRVSFSKASRPSA